MLLIRISLHVCVILACGASWVSAETSDVGFLVVAPDRGYLGNQEIQTVFEQFKERYAPASLALVGRDYNGVGSEYSSYLSRAVQELARDGAARIVAIPLFLSEADPVLRKVIAHLPAYTAARAVRWAPAMAQSYLTGQIMLDRVEATSQDPQQERLFMIGVGAPDEAGEQALKADLGKLAAYVSLRKAFKEVQAVVYYDRDAAGAEDKNKAVDALLMQAAAKKGRTIAVPATLGPKFDHSMALTNWLGDKFREMDVAYVKDELLPHPNVLLWLKKTANRYLPASAGEIGVIVMPHGATQPWNDAVEHIISPLKTRYPLEIAFGMGDAEIIQQAVTRLEDQGIRRIVFGRMYALSHHMKERIEYILGLAPAPASHDHDHPLPAQVRSAALFAGFGGYEEYPGVAEILHQRIMEVSQEPSTETVLLLAHGDRSEEGNAKWMHVMQSHIERLRQDPHCARLRALRAATAREDWPELRDPAMAEIKASIREDAKQGRVLVIANRLYGSGPYKKLLADVEYVLNEKGLAHPLLTRWLEEEVDKAAAALAAPLDDAPPIAGR